MGFNSAFKGLNLTRITGTLHEDQYTYLIISRSILLRMRNVSDKDFKTHTLCSITFFFENHAVYEIMWKNIVERGRPQTTIWRMRTACWITKATNTHSENITHCFSTTTVVTRTRHAGGGENWILLVPISTDTQIFYEKRHQSDCLIR
jgi:hypothetical protein